MASFNAKLEAGEFIKARKCVNFGEFMRAVCRGLKWSEGDSTLEDAIAFPSYALGRVKFRTQKGFFGLLHWGIVNHRII